jgi:hypothetical protein
MQQALTVAHHVLGIEGTCWPFISRTQYEASRGERQSTRLARRTAYWLLACPGTSRTFQLGDQLCLELRRTYDRDLAAQPGVL